MCIRKDIQDITCKWLLKLKKSSWIHKCHISPHYFDLDINPHKGTQPSFLQIIQWEKPLVMENSLSIPGMILCHQLYIVFRNVTSASFFPLSTHKFHSKIGPIKKIIRSYNIGIALYEKQNDSYFKNIIKSSGHGFFPSAYRLMN